MCWPGALREGGEWEVWRVSMATAVAWRDLSYSRDVVTTAIVYRYRPSEGTGRNVLGQCFQDKP